LVDEGAAVGFENSGALARPPVLDDPGEAAGRETDRRARIAPIAQEGNAVTCPKLARKRLELAASAVDARYSQADLRIEK
jgi:hypothetical protein